MRFFVKKLKNGKITNICTFMNETTDLLKILQNYVAF